MDRERAARSRQTNTTGRDGRGKGRHYLHFSKHSEGARCGFLRILMLRGFVRYGCGRVASFLRWWDSKDHGITRGALISSLSSFACFLSQGHTECVFFGRQFADIFALVFVFPKSVGIVITLVRV